MSVLLRLISGTPPALNCTLSATEAQDTTSMSVAVLVNGTLAVTETGDSAAFGAVALVSASLAATESADSAAFGATVTAAAALAATEAQDIAAFIAEVISERNADLAATESPDIFAGTAEAPEIVEPKFSEYKRPWWEYPERTVSVRASEQPDRASMFMAVTGISDEEITLFMMALMEEEEVLV